VTIHVHGRSGMGKTALVRRFLDALRRRGEVVVLEGRCYERESVPYKAFDSLIDALARHLSRVPPERAVALLPPEAQDLARMFPVLQGVEASLAAAGDRREGAQPGCDPQELRRGAFRGL